MAGNPVDFYGTSRLPKIVNGIYNCSDIVLARFILWVMSRLDRSLIVYKDRCLPAWSFGEGQEEGLINTAQLRTVNGTDGIISHGVVNSILLWDGNCRGSANFPFDFTPIGIADCPLFRVLLGHLNHLIMAYNCFFFGVGNRHLWWGPPWIDRKRRMLFGGDPSGNQ